MQHERVLSGPKNRSNNRKSEENNEKKTDYGSLSPSAL